MSSMVNGAAQPATTEARRLSRAFEQIARVQLVAMAASARAIVRAWAEAEVAIEAARRSGEPDASELPPAEGFRTVPFRDREEVSSERITRWRGRGFQPLSDEDNDRVIHRNGSWFLPQPGTDRPAWLLSEQALFDRVTYAEPQAMVEAPLLIASLSVPGLIAGGEPGWRHPADAGPQDATAVLAYLDATEGGVSSGHPDRKCTVEHQYVTGAGRPKPPVSTPAV